LITRILKEAKHALRFTFCLVVTENSVRSENTGIPAIGEIMVATTMSSLFVALFALIACSFRTRAALQAEIRFATSLRFSRRTRRVACASMGATGSCGLCCTDSGPVGGDVSRWSNARPASPAHPRLLMYANFHRKRAHVFSSSRGPLARRDPTGRRAPFRYIDFLPMAGVIYCNQFS
jgi:hypothetical protein